MLFRSVLFIFNSKRLKFCPHYWLYYFRGHSEEGDPFRESYSRLAELRSFVRHDTVFVGMSATVTPSNRAKILASLGMTDAALIAVDPNKANIT